MDSNQSERQDVYNHAELVPFDSIDENIAGDWLRDLEVYQRNHESGKQEYFSMVDELRERIHSATSQRQLLEIVNEAYELDEWAELWIDHWKASPTTYERLLGNLEKRQEEMRKAQEYRAHLISVGTIVPEKESEAVR